MVFGEELRDMQWGGPARPGLKETASVEQGHDAQHAR